MGDSLAAVSLGTGRSATAVACGWQYHSCVLLDDGRLKCFGQSSSGQLGLLTTFDRGDGPSEMGDFLPVVQLGSGVTAANVTLGQYFSCVTLSSGQLKCFGLNGFGQLGQGDVLTRGDGPGNMGDILPFVAVGTGRSIVAMSLGWYHSCVILDDGQLKCFGYNSNGQLGQGDTSTRGDGPGEMGDSLAAVSLGTGRNATAVACGGSPLVRAPRRRAPQVLRVQRATASWAWATRSTAATVRARWATVWRRCLWARAAPPRPSLAASPLVRAPRRRAPQVLRVQRQRSAGPGRHEHRGDGPGEMGDSLAAVSLGTGRNATAVACGYTTRA
jgi:hypothetical protein